MTSSQVSLVPCMACAPGVIGQDQILASGPCCDESCLDNVARRECILQCGEDESMDLCGVQGSNISTFNDATVTSARGDVAIVAMPSEPGSPGTQSQARKRKREPCGGHSHSVRDRYAATLSSLGCICKVLVASNLAPCCDQSQRRSARDAMPRASCSSVISVGEGKHVQKAPQCGSGADGCAAKKPSRNLGSPRCSDESCCRKSTGESSTICSGTGCCGPEDNADKIQEEKYDCCRPGKSSCSNTRSTGCSDAKEIQHVASLRKPSCKQVDGVDAPCCDSEASGSGGLSKTTCETSAILCSEEKLLMCDRVTERPEDTIDVEKGGVALEHVVLNVQGLTCTGCETKLFKSISTLPGVVNLQTSLVLSQAEFDLDETAGPVSQVIRSVEKATGFTCQRLNAEGQEIEIVVSGDAKDFVARKYPDGVTQMVAIDKHTVRITYDTSIIGARTLLASCFDASVRLAEPRDPLGLDSGKKHIRKTALITLLSTVLTIPVLILAWAPLSPRPITYGGVSLALATVVQFAVAGPFYPSALRALIFTHVIEMDLLIVLSTSTAYIFSVVSFAYQIIDRPLATGEFFETSTLLVTLIMLGRLVSAFARQRAVELVSIRSLQAATAVLVDADGHNEQEIDTRLLQHGDLFKVMPHSRIATDGVIISGTTEVDESMVTGESLPVEKFPGSSVIAGSQNGSGIIVVRLRHLPGNNTISIIAAMVDEAKFSKPKTQELVDRVASYFVPVILSLTLVAFATWIAIGLAIRHQSGGSAAVNALTYAISVLIVCCPCAIGLAVPMVVVICGGVAAQHGVVFKSALAIETARKVSHVVFDKTGTLTQGELSVIEEIYLSDDPQSAASIALGLTCNSKHPISTAMSSYLKRKRVIATMVENVHSITSKGIEGNVNGVNVRCGNTRWLSVKDHPRVQDLFSKNLTVIGVAEDSQLIALYGLSDTLRNDSLFVVSELQNRMIAISIVSGDDASAVNAIALKLNVPASHVRSRCTPDDKQNYLKTVMADGNTTVIFCGDGTNDAVALAQADIGVHMNSGSDVARTAADVVLVRPDLSGILVLLDLSKAAFHRICFNFVWSFVYNLFAILLAAGAFVYARIPPQYAGLGEIVSVLPVILIALQLRWFKRSY